MTVRRQKLMVIFCVLFFCLCPRWHTYLRMSSSARAITCYECDSVNNPGCGENFAGDDIATSDCEAVADMRAPGMEPTCLTKYYGGSEYISHGRPYPSTVKYILPFARSARRNAIHATFLLLRRLLALGTQLRWDSGSRSALSEFPGMQGLHHGSMQRVWQRNSHFNISHNFRVWNAFCKL